MRAFIKGFPENGALGHEGVAESYAAGDEQPAVQSVDNAQFRQARA